MTLEKIENTDEENTDEELKMWLIVRKDLYENNMLVDGKLAAQAGHAFIESYLKCLEISPNIADKYQKSSNTKIIVSVKNDNELIKIITLAKEQNIPCSLIKDQGRTIFNGPTITVGAIGPIFASSFKPIKRLQLLKNRI